MMDDALLARHLPVITNRLRFFPQSISSPPVITPRMEFGERLMALAHGHTPREILSTDSALTDIAASVTDSVTPPADLGSDSGGEEQLHDAFNKKIAKPRGQAGHPGSGGYSLDVVLRKWGSSLIGDVNKLVKQKADQLLDTNHSYRMQNPSDIEDVCHIVEKTYPIVAKYQSAWPVKDMLKQHLKYTSESARKGDLTKKKGKGRISTS